MRAALLCLSCDVMDPAGVELLALFAVDNVVTQGNLSALPTWPETGSSC